MDAGVAGIIAAIIAAVAGVVTAMLTERRKKLPESLSDTKQIQPHAAANKKVSDVYTNAVPLPPIAQEEVDFIKAYLTFIKPTIGLSDRYADILSSQYDRLIIEVKYLEKKRDWMTLLLVKQLLREYFEYSGKYMDGVEFGRMYYGALKNLQQVEEAIWTRVKHIGYLLVLAGQHESARKELEGSLRELSNIPPTDSVYECCFYCNRYLGISYQRDQIAGSVERAKEYFQKAREYIDFFKHDEIKQKELSARLLGNLGNIALDERRYADALNSYRESHALFLTLNDMEHIGISKLQIAQTLISNEEGVEEALTLLNEAKLIFIDIGWLEGEARIEEQYARIYEYKAKKSRSLKQQQYIEQSLSAARRSETLFRRIGLERAIGRLEEIKNRLKNIS